MKKGSAHRGSAERDLSKDRPDVREVQVLLGRHTRGFSFPQFRDPELGKAPGVLSEESLRTPYIRHILRKVTLR